jgi:RNA polymerase sigma factor (sigma-70 family)
VNQVEVKKMIRANEVNSTFYALRLLTHGLHTSQIEVTDGEEYPASEFTKEEQEQALKIIHGIADAESISFDRLPPERIHFYLTSLADRIEELANSDLADAGYTLQLPRTPFVQAKALSSGVAPPEALAARELDLALAEVAEINPRLRRIFELYYIEGYSIARIAEVMDLSRAAIRTTLAMARARLRKA